MSDRMLVSVEWKAATGGDPGELDGYVSVFNNVDQGGDVVLPGAFRKTLADWSRAKQRLPLIADHNLSTEGVIGSVVEAKEDGVGLRIRAKFSTNAKAQDVRRNLLEGHINGLSFTYEALKKRAGMLGGKAVRYLEELRIFEATVTPFPMNIEAVTLGVKADEPAVSEVLDFAQFTDGMRKALDIGFEPARKAAVDVLLDAYHPNDDAADPDGVTADAAATTPSAPAGTASDVADKSTSPQRLTPREYADQIMRNNGQPDGSPASLDQLEAEIQRALGGAK